MSVNQITDILKLPNETKSILKILFAFGKYLLIFSFVPILTGLALAYYFYKKEKEKDTVYRAKITFIETDKINNAGSSIGAAQLGGLLNNRSGDAVETSLEGILRSDRLLENALFSPVSEVDSEMLINLYFRIYFPDEFEELRVTVANVDSLSLPQKRRYSQVKNSFDNANENLIFVNSEDILSIEILTSDEKLSYSFVNNLYKALSEFYESNTTEVYDNTLEYMIRARDSTYQALKNYEGQLAKVETGQNFRIIPTEQIPNINLKEKIQLTQDRYHSLFFEVEDYKVRNKLTQGVFEQLSRPIIPLPKTEPDGKSKALIGGVVGFIIGLFVLVLIYILRIIAQLFKKLNLDEDLEPEPVEAIN